MAAVKERNIEPNLHRILFGRPASDQITYCILILLTIAAFSVTPVLSNKGHQWQEDSIVNDVSILS